MPKRLRIGACRSERLIGSRKTALTSVGLAMFIGFSALGVGWSSLESIWLNGFGAGRHSPHRVSVESGRADNVEDEPVMAELGTDRSVEELTPEEKEQDRLKQLAQTHTIDAWEFLEDRKYWRAIREAQTAIKIDPQCFDAYDVRDRAFKKLGISRKKREIMIQGVMCNVRTGVPIDAGMTKKERRELLSKETDLFGMRGITDRPLVGF